MINKKNLIIIFIIFFIFNIFYCAVYKTYAATLTVSKSDISVDEVGGTVISVYLYNKSLYDSNATYGGLEYTTSFPVSSNKKEGKVSVSIGPAQVESGYIKWDVGIKGVTAGEAKIMFSIGDEFSPSVTVTVNPKKGSGGSSASTNTVTINTDILRDDFAEEFDPNSEIGGYNVSQPIIKVIIPVVNRILAILQIIGAIVLVIALAIAGFNGILGSGDGFSEDLGLNVGSSINEYGNSVTGVQNLTKGSLSKILRRAFIGTIILEFSATIVRIVFSIVTNI